MVYTDDTMGTCQVGQRAGDDADCGDFRVFLARPRDYEHFYSLSWSGDRTRDFLDLLPLSAPWLSTCSD